MLDYILKHIFSIQVTLNIISKKERRTITAQKKRLYIECLTINLDGRCISPCSYIALLLGAILEEGVHQLGVNEVPGVQAVEHPVAAVMGDAAEDGETGDQDGVTVVAERPVLDQSDERVQAPESDELVTHAGVRAESGINNVINIINIIIDDR